MNVKSLVISTLAVLTVDAVVAAAAPAQTVEVPLTCEQAPGAKQRCSLASKTLADAQDFQAEVRLSYDFRCGGQAIGVVFAGDGGQVPVRFGGSGAEPVDLVGYGPFAITDANPALTYRATLVGDCIIKVSTVSLLPSRWQLQSWQDGAASLARLLDAELGELKLAKSLVDVVAWDDEQLGATLAQVTAQLQVELPADLPYSSLIYPVPCDKPGKCGQLKDAQDMPDGWSLAAITNPDLPSQVALRAQIVSVEAGRPAYDTDTTARVTAQLTTDVEQASKIIAAGDQWIQVIDADLKALVERLKALRAAAATA